MKYYQAKYRLLLVHVKQLQNTIERLESLRTQKDEVNQTLKEYQGYVHFPAQHKDELLKSDARLTDTIRRVETLEKRLATNQEIGEELDKQLQSLTGYEQITETLKEISDLESRYKLLVKEAGNRHDVQVEAQKAFKNQSDQLKAYESKFCSMDRDRFEKVLQDVTQLQHKQTILSLSKQAIVHETKQIQNLNHQMQGQKTQVKLLMAGGAISLIATAVCLAFIMPVSFVLFPIALLGGFIALQKQKQVKHLESQMADLSANLENLNRDAQKAENEVNEVKRVVADLFEQVGVSSPDALKAEYDKFQNHRQEVERLNDKVDEVGNQLQEAEDERQQTEQQLCDLVAPVVDSPEVFTVKSLATVWENVNHYQSLIEQQEDLKAEAERLESERSTENETTDELDAHIDRILKAAKVETVDQFLQAVKKQLLYEGAAKSKAELKLLLGEKTVEAFRGDLNQQQSQLDALVNAFPCLSETGDLEIGLSLAKEGYELISQERSTAKETLHELQTQRQTRLSESIKHLEEHIAQQKRSIAEIEPKQSKLVSTTCNKLKRQKITQLEKIRNQEAKLENATSQLEKLQTKQRSILEQANVETLEAYHQGCEKRSLETCRIGFGSVTAGWESKASKQSSNDLISLTPNSVSLSRNSLSLHPALLTETCQCVTGRRNPMKFQQKSKRLKTKSTRFKGTFNPIWQIHVPFTRLRRNLRRRR